MAFVIVSITPSGKVVVLASWAHAKPFANEETAQQYLPNLETKYPGNTFLVLPVQPMHDAVAGKGERDETLPDHRMPGIAAVPALHGVRPGRRDERRGLPAVRQEDPLRQEADRLKDEEPLPATVANMRRAVEAGLHPLAYSPTTREENSATPGDYFMLPDNEPLTDHNGDVMILALKTPAEVGPIFPSDLDG